jgi:hypothetical protein
MTSFFRLDRKQQIRDQIRELQKGLERQHPKRTAKKDAPLEPRNARANALGEARALHLCGQSTKGGRAHR